ncbi:hypothetical protein BDQ17DRAFT_1429560 [Cyathus striatus]|nr:hypothetical protein BDQ17DRAFT_1429560 [Cyathus striatus]
MHSTHAQASIPYTAHLIYYTTEYDSQFVLSEEDYLVFFEVRHGCEIVHRTFFDHMKKPRQLFKKMIECDIGYVTLNDSTGQIEELISGFTDIVKSLRDRFPIMAWSRKERNTKCILEMQKMLFSAGILYSPEASTPPLYSASWNLYPINTFVINHWDEFQRRFMRALDFDGEYIGHIDK